jgi:hypothetical protein
MCIVVVFAVTFNRLDIFMLAPAVPVLFPRVGVPCCVMDGSSDTVREIVQQDA